MIYRLDSDDNENDRVGQQWVDIYGHEISSSNMKQGMKGCQYLEGPRGQLDCVHQTDATEIPNECYKTYEDNRFTSKWSRCRKAEVVMQIVPEEEYLPS